jgi:diacylglycerol kinase family enzyme
MAKHTTAIAVINTAAGGVGVGGLEHMRTTLADLGAVAEVVPLDLSQAEQQFRQLASSDHDRVIVWGGDGTHRAALSLLGRKTDRLVLLPGGTMNLLSKWIHGDRPWREILRSILAASRSRPLPAGRAGEEYFFCALLAGVPACFADIREDLRVGQFGHVLQDVGAAFDVVGRLHLRSREGTAATGAGRDSTNVVGAFVGPLSKNGRMDVAAFQLPSLLSAVDFAWQSFRSAWRDLAGVAPHAADRLFVDAEDGLAIPVIVDGERVSLGSSFQVEFVDKAAQCLVAG